jgi:pimeloyl-ACP methyl ester carboxylesterase
MGAFSTQRRYGFPYARLRYAERRRVSILGYSIGGPIGHKYAARFPERVDCLVLMDS